MAQSLFPGRDRVDGSEVVFRTVCALGWAILQRLPELREITQNDPHTWLHWLEEFDARIIGDFNASSREADNRPEHLQNRLTFLSTHHTVTPFPHIVDFLKGLIVEVRTGEALDPISQFDHFNRSGFELATQMISDGLWSTSLVTDRWDKKTPHPWAFSETTAGGVQPVTVMTKDRIEIRINTVDFDRRHALLFYLTLDYQMMHEYISHLLPAWNSGNALEEQYLLAMMFLFYRSERVPRDGIHPLLVHRADERRNDSHRERRVHIQQILAPMVGEGRLSQQLLELAVLRDDEMSGAKKRRLLAYLNRLPVTDSTLQPAIEHWLRTEDLATLYGKLSTVFDP